MSRSVLARMGAVAAGSLALGIAMPAWAASTVVLSRSGINKTAAGFSTKDCTNPYPDKTSNEDGWHFALPSSSGDSFGSVTLTYDGGVVGPVTSIDVNVPDTGTGWAAYIDDSGSTGKFRHVYVTTTSGWKLLSGTSKVDPDGHDGDTFKLSQTCSAQAAPGGSRSGSTTSPNGAESTSTPPSTSQNGSPQPDPSSSEAIAGGTSGSDPTGSGTNSSDPTGGGASGSDSTGGGGDGYAYDGPNGAPETGGGGSMRSNGFVLGTGALLISGMAALGLVLAARRRRTIA